MQKKELIFMILLTAWVFLACFPGLKQPLYWDSAYSLGSHAKRIAINFNLLNYREKTEVQSTQVYTSFINQESDYPHTFGLAMFYAFSLALFPNNYYVIWHHVSLLFSIGLLVVIYFLFRENLAKFKTGMILALLASNPIFLAQTTLVYHEIPGALFKYLAIYFLIKNQKNYFLLSALIAFLIRFENGPMLIGTAVIWLGLIKNWKLSLIDVKKAWKQIFILCLAVCLWFFIHLKLNGYLIISPLFGHEINRQKAVQDLYHFLFIEQGRWLISILTLFLVIFNFKNIKENKKIISVLLLVSVSIFAIVWYLGNSLPRYTTSILPFYYFLFVLVLPKHNNLKTKILLSMMMLSILFYQSSFAYKCTGNLETCLSFTRLVSLKKEVAIFLEKNMQNNSSVYVNWDEIEEFSNPEHGLSYFCKNCTQANLKNFPINASGYEVGDYLVITPNSTSQTLKIKENQQLKLIQNFGSNKLDAKLYQLVP